VPGREPDDLAEKLLVDLAEDVRRQHAELIRALGIVEAPEDVLEGLVVDSQAERQPIGSVGAAPLGLEVEEARVVAVIGLDVDFPQARVDVLAVHEAAQAPVGLNAAVFADAQEDEAVDSCLDSEVELALAERRVAQGDVAGERIAPELDLAEEGLVDLGGALLGLGRLGVAVEGALEDGFFGEHAGNLLPALLVLLARHVERTCYRGLVGVRRAHAAVVDGKLLEVGQQGKRELGRPSVAAQLIGRCRVVLQIDRWLLCLDEELALAADAERVVGGPGVEADLDGVFVDHVFVLLRVAGLVVDVPAESAKEGVDELASHLGLVVGGVEILLAVARKALDEFEYGIWCGHLIPRLCAPRAPIGARCPTWLLAYTWWRTQRVSSGDINHGYMCARYALAPYVLPVQRLLTNHQPPTTCRHGAWRQPNRRQSCLAWAFRQNRYGTADQAGVGLTPPPSPAVGHICSVSFTRKNSRSNRSSVCSARDGRTTSLLRNK